MICSKDLMGLSLGLAFAFVSATLVADENSEGYFSTTSVEQLSKEAPTAFVVGEVVPQSPAEKAGVLAGDRVLAVDGRRIYGYAEYSYILSYFRPRSTTISLIIDRHDRLLELELDEAPIVAKIGIVPVRETFPWIELAERLDEDLDPEARYVLSTCNPRLALLATSWLDEDASRAANADWLRKVLRMRILLSEQRWDEALPIEEEIPIPELKRVVSFWNAVASDHVAGRGIPDPGAFAEGIDYFCFNYPLPRFVPPPLGDFETNDRAWEDRLLRLSRDFLDRPEPYDEDGVFEAPEARPLSIDPYLARVKLSAVSPEWHSGWPYRYAGQVYDVANKWQLVYEELQHLREKDPKDRALYTYALAQMVFRQKDRCDESLKLLEELHGLSPFLAWRAADSNRHNVRLVSDDPAVISQFDGWYESHRGPLAPRDDWPMRYLLARSRTGARLIDPFVPPPYDDYSFYSPAYFRNCIDRERPFKDEYEELKRDVVSKKFSTKREVLYRRLEDLTAPFFEGADLEVLASIDRNGRSSGMLLDALARVLEREAVRERDFANFARSLEVVGGHLRETPGADVGYARVSRELRAIDWTDTEAAIDKVERIYRLYGRLRATTEIAAFLHDWGLDEAAQRYDDRLERYLDLTLPFMNAVYPGWVNGHKRLANAYAPHPKLAERMERTLRQLERDASEGRFSTSEYLAEMEAYRAHCLVTMKRPSDAAAALARSYSMKTSDPSAYEFSFEGRTVRDLAAYRRWLIDQIVAEQGVPQETKDQLLSFSAMEAG